MTEVENEQQIFCLVTGTGVPYQYLLTPTAVTTGGESVSLQDIYSSAPTKQ